MKRFTKAVALLGAGLLALAGPVAADGHARTVIAFDLEVDGAAEGVAVNAAGDVFTGLSAKGQMLKIPGGEGEAEVLTQLEGLAAGDFGFTGHALDQQGMLYSAVVSSNPELNGLVRIDPASGATEHIAGTEAIGMANGIGSDGSDFYVSDSVAGAIWRVTIPFVGDAQPTVEPWISDPLLAGTGAMPLPFPVGANGVALKDQVVYVGVTEQSQVVGIPISSDGSAGEPFVYLELPGVAIDGIAFDLSGNLYAADPPGHTLWKVAPDGAVSAVADVDDGLSGPSSVTLLEGPFRSVAYVSNQAIGDPPTIKHGPSIVAVDL